MWDEAPSVSMFLQIFRWAAYNKYSQTELSDVSVPAF